MKLSEVIKSVRVELLDEAGVSFPDDDLIALASKAESELCRETRIYETNDQFTTTAGLDTYQLPKNWVAAKMLFTADLDSAGKQTWVRLSPTSLEKMAQEHPNFLSDDATLRGNPRLYWIDGTDRIFIYPRPMVDSVIKMFFVGIPPAFATIDDQIHIPQELSEGIGYYLLSKCSAKDQDDSNEAKHWANWLGMIKKAHTWRNRRQLDARNQLGDLDSNRGYTGGLSNGPSIGNVLG